MSAALRHRVDAATFELWRTGVPALMRVAEPARRAGSDGDEQPASPAPTPPPAVAAALAVHVDAAAWAIFGRAEHGPVVGCVSIGHPARSPGLASSVVQGPGWIEIALIGVPEAVEEVMRWLPRGPGWDCGVGLQLFRRGQPTPCWAPLRPADPAALAEQLRMALTECLARPASDCLPDSGVVLEPVCRR